MFYTLAKLNIKLLLRLLLTEHQQDSFDEKCATEHCLECHGQFNRIKPKTLLFEQHYHKQIHCVKSVRIRSYSGPYFPAFGLNTERYGMWENADQNNSVHVHFLRSDYQRVVRYQKSQNQQISKSFKSE